MGMMINRRRVCGGKSLPYDDWFIDLGLPSGILWADRNIGADSPNGYGLYFSWGNIDGHAHGSGYNFSKDNYNTTSGSRITGDIPLSQDAANTYWGGDCRMPTRLEFQELNDNCNAAWVTENGVSGLRYTSKTNGNSIFFPAAGLYDGTTPIYRGSDCYFWSASYYNVINCYGVDFYKTGRMPQYIHSRFRGFSVRPVKQ